jgi:hypothetical protein
MEEGIQAQEQIRLRGELAELLRQEEECLCRAVSLVEERAPGAAIRAVYAEMEAARSGKNRVLRQLSLLARVNTEEAHGLQPPGHRSGSGAAEAWPYLQSDALRKGRHDVGD